MNWRDEVCSEYLMEKFSGFIYTFVLYVFYVPALKNVQCVFDKPINALYVNNVDSQLDATITVY
jgi:hypothetical protein